MKLLNQFNMSYEDYFFWGLCFSFIIEQVFYRFLGSYPYKYGPIIKSIKINQSILNEAGASKLSDLVMKTAINKDIYFYKRYAIGLLAPLLFCGRIQFNKVGILTIRMGPITAVFIIYLIIHPIFSAAYYHFVDSALILLLVLFLYSKFVDACKSISSLKTE